MTGKSMAHSPWWFSSTFANRFSSLHYHWLSASKTTGTRSPSRRIISESLGHNLCHRKIDFAERMVSPSLRHKRLKKDGIGCVGFVAHVIIIVVIFTPCKIENHTLQYIQVVAIGQAQLPHLSVGHKLFKFTPYLR